VNDASTSQAKLVPALLLTFTLLVATLAAAAASAQSEPSTLFVATGHITPELEPIAEGVAEWIRQRVAGTEATVVPGPGMRRGFSLLRSSRQQGGDKPTTGALLAHASKLAAAEALLVDLRWERGKILADFRLYEVSSGILSGGALVTAEPMHLIVESETALADIYHRLGVKGAAPSPHALAAHGIDELSAVTRALVFLDQEVVVRSWRALLGQTSTTAERLRGEITTAAAGDKIPLAERARLSAARGEVEGAWSLITEQAPAAYADPSGSSAMLVAAGEVQLERGVLDQSRAYFEKALELRPNNAEASLGLGRVLIAQKQLDGARRAFEHSAKHDPSSPRPLELLAELERPALQARLVLEAGDRHAAQLSTAPAQIHFERAVAMDPSLEAVALERSGTLYARTGAPEQAIASLERSNELGGKTTTRMLRIARAQAAMQQPEASQLTLLEIVDEIDPQSGAAFTELGELYSETEQPGPAVGYLEQAVALQPNEARPKRSLARALHQRRGEGDVERAVELLEASEANAPFSAADLRELAALQHETGNLGGAAASLERALDLRALDLEAQRAYVQVLEQKGDVQSASMFADRFSTAGLQDFILDDETLAALAAARRSGGEAGLEQIDALVSSFGGASVGVERVVLLGLRETTSGAERILRWVRPRRSKLARVEDELAETIAAQYVLVEPELVQEYIQTSIDSLFDFQGKASRDVLAITDVNIALDVDGVFVAQISAQGAVDGAPEGSCLAGPHYQLQLRRLSGQQDHEVQLLANSACLEGGANGAYGDWNYYAAAPWSLALLILLYPVLRGWGSVTIDFKLPPKSKALFAVRLSQKPGKVKDRSEKSKGKARYVFERQLKDLEHRERRLQGERMEFRWVPARRTPYYITVRGPLLDLTNDELVGEFLEERKILVKRREHLQVDFNMCSLEAAIIVNVKRGEEAVSRARLSFRGVTNSLRYVSEGSGMLYAKKGEHVIVVGTEDRVAEIPLDVSELVPLSLTVDIASESDLLFKDCPDAVGPYLEGDWGTAATALEHAGQTSVAHRVRALLHRERGDKQALARELEAAGDLAESATLRREAAQHDQSAILFEEAGEFAQAAEAYQAAGDLASAARCYESAYDWPNAIECYQDLGDIDKVLALMERSGEIFEAGCLAAEQNLLDRAIDNLQQVDTRHPRYSESCRVLAEVLERKGEMDLAAEKFDQAVKLAGGDDAPLEMLGNYARLLEQAQRDDEALSVYENIRRRDLRFKDVGTHIEQLRKRTTQLVTENSDEGSQTMSVGAARTPAESLRYEILGELGRGGMGVVYKAKDRHLERIVALKVLSENLRQHQSALELFLREARSAAALNHRNIVIVYDAGQEGDMDFISMERLEGVGLDSILKKRGSLDYRTAASVALQVVAGLDYAQQSKIIHRDIKPSNLFVTKERVVKIMDFGLAKMVEEVRRSSTVIGGTPNYMAPEQAVGEATDHRTDLYALGGTLFHLVTGGVPFEAGDVAYHHAHSPPPDARERELSVPAEMAELIMKLMAKKPEDRYQSAREVAAVLQHILK